MPVRVAAAILAVTASISNVAKKGRNEHHKFNYQHWDDVLPAVRAACIEHGLLVLQEITDVSEYQAFTGYNNNGAETYQARVRVRVSFTFCDTKSGEHIEREYVGEAANFDDKGINKAVTSATKYLYIKTFQIQVQGEVSDNDASDGKKGSAEKPKAAPQRPAHPAEPFEHPAEPAAAARPALVLFGMSVARKPDDAAWKEPPTEKQRNMLYGKCGDHGIDKNLAPWLALACAKEGGFSTDGIVENNAAALSKAGAQLALAVMLNKECASKMAEQAALLYTELGDPFAEE